MAKVELRYVQAFTDRHGHRRHYFRRPGCARVALPGQPGSTEFMAAYTKALGEGAPEMRLPRYAPGSIAALIVAYYRSQDWLSLRDSTKRAYRSTLEALLERDGHLPVKGLQPKHVNAMLDAYAGRPGAASNLRKRLRQLMTFAVERGWRDDNPVIAIKRRPMKTEGFAPWSEADIAAYEKRWPSSTRERLALALLLYTGQRRSDVVGMGRQHVSGTRISVRQIKTDARLRIPMHPALAAEIALAPRDGLAFLLTQFGVPFTANGFGDWFRARAEAAGVTKRAHGLRKAAGRRLAEAGCSAREIASVLGHTTLTEVERYTRDADQAKLAETAFARLREAGS